MQKVDQETGENIVVGRLDEAQIVGYPFSHFEHEQIENNEFMLEVKLYWLR